MARILEGQNKWPQACEIYRFLIEENPGRQDLVRALKAAEDQCRDGADDRLVRLLGKWIQLLGTLRRVRQLKALGQSGRRTGDT